MAIEAARLPATPPVGGTGDHDAALQVARQLVGAVAARDRELVAASLAGDVRFRYLVPSGAGTEAGSAEAEATFFRWFGDAGTVEIEDVRVEPIADRTSVSYRFRVLKPAGWRLIEQRAYLDVGPDGRISEIDLVCSGFRPTGDSAGSTEPGSHVFDAGTMSCADGLAGEFRRRIGAIPVGDVLQVTARDPAAREDLPPLARLMGHAVRSVEDAGDGTIMFTVEKGR